MPKSTSGTNIMEIKALSGKDICAIIESCSKSSVRELTIGDMSIKFGPSDQGEKVTVAGTLTPEQIAEASSNPEQDESFVEAMQSRTQEDILSTQTLMDDPMAFEEEVMNSFVYQGGANAN